MPTTFSTTVPTTVPEVCDDITQLTESTMSDLPLSEVSIQPIPSSKASDFEFTSPEGVSAMEYSITAQKGGKFVSLNLEGTFTSYQVFVADDDGSKSTPLEDTTGKDTFAPGEKFDFNRDIEVNDTVTIIITGPTSGFAVEVSEFSLCLPEFKYCQLTQAEVLEQLSYLPLNGILGISRDDNGDVNYGLDMAQGDVLEEGTVVKGHCYECECINFTLVCTPIENCECPDYTSRCEGSCDDPVLIVEFEAEGVDPNCKPNDTCTPEDCTTPFNCPTPWGEWGECIGCQRSRERACDEGCGEICKNLTYSEVESCGVCTTTQICDDDNEEWQCYNHYVRCNETCRTLHNQDSCLSLLIEDEDMECNYSCACKHGYKRNAAGVCVKEDECECYNGTIPLPVNFREEINACKYCECKMGYGMVCEEKPDCCDLSEWEEWSACSATCGEGIRTRTRTELAGNCVDVDILETEKCEVGECPCIIDGVEYGPNDIIDDECRYCKCEMGELYCVQKNKTEPWSPSCDETCYCAAEDGEKICVNTTKICDVDPVQCNNDTHYTVEDPEDPCCMLCQPRMKPCEKQVVETRMLNFTAAPYGYCVSPPLEVSSCVGSCGFSESGGSHYEWKHRNEALPLFDLDYFSSCECCQAQLAASQVEFKCDNQETVTISVTQIASCQCLQCT